MMYFLFYKQGRLVKVFYKKGIDKGIDIQCFFWGKDPQASGWDFALSMKCDVNPPRSFKSSLSRDNFSEALQTILEITIALCFLKRDWI